MGQQGKKVHKTRFETFRLKNYLTIIIEMLIYDLGPEVKF